MAEAEEPDYLNLAAKLFEKDKRAILVLLTKAKELAKKEKSSVNWDAIVPDVLEYLEGESAEMWAQTFAPLVAGSVANAGDFWSVELGVRFDVRNIDAEKWFQEYMLEFAQPITETTANNITELLGLGMADGLTVQQMQKLISEEFEQWARGTADPDVFHFYNTRVPPHRAEMIARTESIRAMNAGSTALFDRWGVKKKEWSAASDARTRDTHRAADGQVVDIDKPFVVGGSNMMYPGDGSMGAPAKEIINCRCSSLPVVEDDEVIPGDVDMEIPKSKTVLNDDSAVRDIDDARAYKKEWAPYIKTMRTDNPDGMAAAERYTHAEFATINNYMRTGTLKANYISANPIATQQEADRVIAGIRSTMSPIGENTRVYRGILDYTTVFGNVKPADLVGTGYTDNAFVSTTVSRDNIGNFLTGQPTNMIIQMEVDSEVSGIYCESFTQVKDENELLLQDGISWIVTGVETQRVGRTDVSVITVRRATPNG